MPRGLAFAGGEFVLEFPSMRSHSFDAILESDLSAPKRSKYYSLKFQCINDEICCWNYQLLTIYS